MDATPRRLGIVWTLAWTHLALLALFLFIGRTGTAARLFAEQIGWVLGMIFTGAKNPDGFLLFLHVAAMLSLGIAMWRWQLGDAHTGRWLRGAAIAQGFIAPLGLPMAAALWWVARRPDLQEATERMTVAGGAARIRIILVWLGATVLTLITSVMAYILFEINLLFWLGAALTCALPQVGALAALLAQRKAPSKDLVPNAMPPLPELGRQP